MIKIEKVSKKYGELEIFDELSLTIPENEVTVILGPSGVGKTTLLNMISKLDENFTGEIIRNYNKLSYVFQEDRLLKWKTVEANIRFVLNNENKSIKSILELLELYDLRYKKVKELSGGQMQRVSIARAFAYSSEFIIMDEPFKSLDIFLKIKIIRDFIKLMENQKRTILLVTHDIREALLLGDNIYIMSANNKHSFKKIRIEIAKKGRQLDDDEMMKYEKEIYKKLKI